MSDQNHIKLLQAFQRGDEAAFETVFKSFYKPLRLQAFLIIKDEVEAEDQVQQLFLEIWNKQLYRNVQQSIRSYLHTAIRNRCYNHVVKVRNENKMWSQYAVHSDPAALIPEADEDEGDIKSCLQAALNELPAQRFHAFQLVHIRDKKYNEAAQEMGISINSLKSHLKLAVKFLRLRLQK